MWLPGLKVQGSALDSPLPTPPETSFIHPWFLGSPSLLPSPCFMISPFCVRLLPGWAKSSSRPGHLRLCSPGTPLKVTSECSGLFPAVFWTPLCTPSPHQLWDLALRPSLFHSPANRASPSSLPILMAPELIFRVPVSGHGHVWFYSNAMWSVCTYHPFDGWVNRPWEWLRSFSNATQSGRGRAGIQTQICTPNQCTLLPVTKTSVNQMVLHLLINQVMNGIKQKLILTLFSHLGFFSLIW